MKVAIVTWFPRDPDKPKGGVEAVSVNLVRALADSGSAQIEVVTIGQGSTTHEQSAWNGARIHRLPDHGARLLSYATGSGRRAVQGFLTHLRPDVVHAHDTFGIMVKGLALPRVFTVHGFIHQDRLYAGGRLSWLHALAWKWFELAAWADQPHIISISPYVRERLRGIARGAIHDIENPLAAEWFAVKRMEQPGTIFCAATLCRRKNALGLVQAMALLREKGLPARLRWAGPTLNPQYEREVNQFLLQRTLGNSVAFLGNLTTGQMRQEMAGASLFALISFEEGAPMSVAEAMAAGVPVLAANRCGMPYMVREGETGFLVDPTRPDETAHRLEQMLGDAALCERLGQVAKRLALERYHPDRVAERTLAVYRQLKCETGRR
jgi:glycosyltransferase involved in cell wall biosynthesis